MDSEALLCCSLCMTWTDEITPVGFHISVLLLEDHDKVGAILLNFYFIGRICVNNLKRLGLCYDV